MKKFLLGTIGLVALGMAAPALAADMAVKAAPVPYVAPIYDWSGFYIGGNGGWASSHNCWSIVPLAGTAFADGCNDRSGGVLGGQIGYRWQASQWVFGLEAQGDWANLTGSRISIFNPAFTTGTRVNGIGLFTGQIGYAWNAALLYLKGGAAVTDNSAFINTTLGGVGIVSASATRWGGALGFGVRVRLLAELDGRSRIRPPLHGHFQQHFLVRSDLCSIPQQPDQPGRGYGHPALQLQIRWLRGTSGRPLLSSIQSPANSKPRHRPGLFCLVRISSEA